MPDAFDLQPTLRGSLVELHPLRPEHFEPLLAVASDPLIWEQHPERDRYRPEVFRKFFDGGLECGGAFVARDARDGRAIGSSRYFGYDANHSLVEIGWTFLARSHWGGHYNAEMKRLMMEHAFRFVDRVLFFVGVNNQRSRRAVEKIGGVLIDTRVKPDGSQFVVFEVTAHAYRQQLPRCAALLRRLVDEHTPRLLALGDMPSAERPAPGKWSPREIIGHLIDSASNNHQRFVRAQFQDSLVFPEYGQDEWVAAQRYASAPWVELVTLWRTFNLHIARVMEAVPTESRLAQRTEHNLDRLAWRTVSADEPATLNYLMEDYVAHLEHHLTQIRAVGQ